MELVKNIAEKISVETPDFSNCISVVEHDLKLTGIETTVRFHYLKFDGNKQPMVKALADTLYAYIIDYCLSAKNRDEALTARQSTILTKEARSLFRHPEISDDSPDKTGEAGETLLYFLMEAVLKAPQVVSKMELKTNHKDEVKGSDGIHARWNEELEVVDFYFGESKLYKKVSDALTSALKSINDFHDVKMYEHEFNMVTKHFKYADEVVKHEISQLFVNGNPGANVRVNHACLIGYDYKGYDDVLLEPHSNLIRKFEDEFLPSAESLVDLLQKKLDKFEKKHLVFDMFFLPFPSVVDFRNAFNEALD
ncbi:HamA C-terminal domain-containing protein [Vreelandella venusta]|uniref:DUF1837 domain-containing protein n=1 Tax=Vreelandella venusta TaxID=44935 RepID=A0AAQ0CFN4_9GAMM|nr:DUF1837 domain-containing protein [Halomonas venusta]QRL02273.1 DUF1837 domain-containing protein [Halomonas venusta]GEK49658.1 hypothetical protein HVE01_03790 [Halomonas venusta]